RDRQGDGVLRQGRQVRQRQPFRAARASQFQAVRRIQGPVVYARRSGRAVDGYALGADPGIAGSEDRYAGQRAYGLADGGDRDDADGGTDREEEGPPRPGVADRHRAYLGQLAAEDGQLHSDVDGDGPGQDPRRPEVGRGEEEAHRVVPAGFVEHAAQDLE